MLYGDCRSGCLSRIANPSNSSVVPYPEDPKDNARIERARVLGGQEAPTSGLGIHRPERWGVWALGDCCSFLLTPPPFATTYCLEICRLDDSHCSCRKTLELNQDSSRRLPHSPLANDGSSVPCRAWGRTMRFFSVAHRGKLLRETLFKRTVV